jgi:hypothetical protein
MTTPDDGTPTAPVPAPPPPPPPTPAAPPAAPGSETLAWPPAGPHQPRPGRGNRFRRWLGTLTPLSAGLLAVVLLAVGFGAGALVGRHHGAAERRVAPGLRHLGPGARPGPPGGPNRQAPPGFGGGTGRGSGGGFGGGFGGAVGSATTGTVASVDGSTMTVRTANGATVTVRISGSTTIRITSNGSVSDLKPGARVIVVGPSSNGSVSARSITTGAGAAGGAAPGS